MRTFSMRSVDPGTFFAHFLEALSKDLTLNDLWHRTHCTKPKFDKTEWTQAMTRVLIEATRATLSSIEPSNRYVCGKGCNNPHGRSEYFNLDIVGLDDGSWGPPFVIIEHENDTDIGKIRYCAWKLMCVEAKLRVLIAYVDRTDTDVYFTIPVARGSGERTSADCERPSR
jgi:hypothetical protein